MSESFIYYGLAIIATLITLGAQLFINSSYSKYRKVLNNKKITGSEAARQILDKNGLNNVKVLEISGELTDHYDPKTKTVNLSSDIYNNSSIASVSVAAHECGHAIQDKVGYIFLRIRASLVPLTNFCSKIGYLAIIIGLTLGALKLMWLGIILECGVLLFELVTLPVEINASRRALKEVKTMQILDSRELRKGKTMLTSAALTYVASVANTIVQILRLVLMSRSNKRNR